VAVECQAQAPSQNPGTSTNVVMRGTLRSVPDSFRPD
jgi:hypothetical protein